jgi:hypothetical protein
MLIVEDIFNKILVKISQKHLVHGAIGMTGKIINIDGILY